MIIWYIILTALAFIPPISIVTGNKCDNEYLLKDNTLALKGLFTILVLFSHGLTYIDIPDAWYNNSYVIITRSIGQLMVAPFFFFSGFGIYEQLKRKGVEYIKDFPRKRLLPIWISFALCVTIYLVLSIIKKTEYSFINVLLSYTGWTSIGNSNWFMCVTFMIYILLFFTFSLSKRDIYKSGMVLFTVLLVILSGILFFVRDSFWSDTILCFPLGMWISKFKSNLDALLFNKIKYLISFGLIICFFALSYLLKVRLSSVFSIVCSLLFCLLLTIMLYKVRVYSKPLKMIGSHVFSVYMLQRIPFNILKGHIDNPYLLFLICLLAAITIAFIYDFCWERVWNTTIVQLGKIKDK